MIEFLTDIDVALFYLFNGSLVNPLFDKLMPFITEVNSWLLLYIVGFVWLFWKGGSHGRILALSLIITILLSDYISSEILKDYFGRLRPCRQLDNVRLLVNCGTGKSFPSSHAVNNFAAATAITFFYKHRWWIFYPLALLVAFSRIYIGVHFPFDALFGSLVGFVISFVIAYLLTRILAKFTNNDLLWVKSKTYKSANPSDSNL